MRSMLSITGSEEFHRRLVEGRGKAPVLMVYRGQNPGVTADDGLGGSAVAGVDECLEEIAQAVGLPISNADVFCGEGRSTLTAYMGIPDTDADIVVTYDTVRRALEIQLLHRDVVTVEYPSNVDLALAKNDTETLIDMHFPQEGDASRVRSILRHLGARPKAPTGGDLSYETYTLELAFD